MKKRNNKIDALRGIAIFLVVLAHSIIYFPMNLHENSICEFIFCFISVVHMPLFFIISGFCYSFKDNYKKYIGKKVKRLLLPYFVFNVIDMFFRYFLSNLVNRPRGIASSLYKILFEGGEYWFIFVLFIIFLIYPLLNKILLKNKNNCILLIILLSFIYLLLPEVKFLLISKVIYYLIFFTIGFFIKNNRKEIFITNYSKKKSFIVMITTLLLWIFLIRFTGHREIEFLLSLIAFINMVCIVQFPFVVMLYKDFGNYSLQLYLLNGYFLTLSRYLIVVIIGINNPYIIVLGNLIIDFYVSYFIIKYVIKKFKILRFLFGMV